MGLKLTFLKEMLVLDRFNFAISYKAIFPLFFANLSN
jgi:hypothetical protein